MREGVQHGGGLRANAAPEEEGLGRLLDQHAQAVASHGTVGGGPVEEALCRRAVHHVEGQRSGAQHAGIDGDARAGKAGRGGVDDDIECFACLRQGRAAHIDTSDAGQIGMPRDQRLGLVHASVRHHELGCRGVDQRAHHTGRGTARADQQHAQAREAQPRIAFDVADQACAVGVVGNPPAGVEAQHVGRLRQGRAFGVPCGEREGVELERHRDVAAAAVLIGEATHRGLEAIQWAQQAAVLHRLAGGLREHRVNEGRLTVFDRIAGHDIAIHEALSVRGWPSRWS